MRRAWLAAWVIAITISGFLTSTAAYAASSESPVDGIPLRDAVTALAVADENREGYERTSFKHWVDADKDRCNTRNEVLIAEAVTPPTVGELCALTGGRWYSYYDNKTINSASQLDIDHMVPLAEAWDSGASQWTADRRERYANDLDEPRALVAVTATTNRSKADQDPTTWLPPHQDIQCGYITDWVTVKTRWRLSIDSTEKQVLLTHAERCTTAVVNTAPAT